MMTRNNDSAWLASQLHIALTHKICENKMSDIDIDSDDDATSPVTELSSTEAVQMTSDDAAVSKL
jgi:hypothetical protein